MLSFNKSEKVLWTIAKKKLFFKFDSLKLLVWVYEEGTFCAKTLEYLITSKVAKNFAQKASEFSVTPAPKQVY